MEVPSHVSKWPRRLRRLHRRTVYRHPWLTVYVDQVQFPAGRILDEHHIVEFGKKAVGALVTNRRGDLLMVKAYRYATQSVGWEIPAGGIEESESALKAAQREVLEESGYSTQRPRLVYTFYPYNGFSPFIFQLVHCRVNARIGAFDRDEIESVGWFSRKNIWRMIRQKTLKDGLTLTALLFYLGIEAHPSGRNESKD